MQEDGKKKMNLKAERKMCFWQTHICCKFQNERQDGEENQELTEKMHDKRFTELFQEWKKALP